MNLIQELGIEKCRAIVDGAPDGANEYSVWASLSYYKTVGERCELWKQHYKWWTPVLYNSYMKQHRRSLDDLRTAIAEHEKCQHKWNETTSNGDAYRFFVCKHCDSTQNYVPFEADHCTDIRNHISPNTQVIER